MSVVVQTIARAPAAGDVILADDDGVVVVRRDHAAAVLAAANTRLAAKGLTYV
jgi:regulator of RNase E activity RraA